MNYFDNLPNSKEFVKFYKKKPHLLKKHQKDFNDNKIKDKYFNYINNYQPTNLKKFINNLGDLYDYERHSIAKVDRDGDKIIVSYYYISDNKGYLKGRVVFVNGKIYNYVYSQWKLTNLYMLKKSSGAYYGNYSDDHYLYSQKQRRLDANSISILKSLPQFKYLPIEKFHNINIIKLFDINQATIYQLELMLKNGYTRLASDLLYQRKLLSMQELALVKPIMKPNVRLEKIIDRLEAIEQKERERKERLTQMQLSKKLEKMQKVRLEIGDFIIKTPSNAHELKHEGLELKHCVYNYLSKIVAKKTQVLFLRKKTDPDTPFYTIEITDKQVMQVRGEHNKAEKKYIKLVNEWYKKGLLKGIA
jgi:hypothetical protein